MSKPSYVIEAEKDMSFEAEDVVKNLCRYAEKKHIERDFIFETFLKAFHKKINEEDEA